jgi:hypothetical protein
MVAELAPSTAGDEACRARMKRQVKRLRELSLDAIDKIYERRSVIDKPHPWGNMSETYAQRIERVLRDAYDIYFEAHDEMRRRQQRADGARERRVEHRH